jgi:hypothetical protein
MSLLISDRDGVLLDTCRANINSYSRAAEKLKLHTSMPFLETAVHDGKAFIDFYFKVWGALTESQLQLLRAEKASVFEEEVKWVRVNHGFISTVIENEEFPFLVTRASLASTIYLLNRYQVNHFAERVVSVNALESKSQVFRRISRELGMGHQSITIIDDSEDVILESRELGFGTVHYPHFCNY